ncbi:hypothetical protein EOD41_04970 [Mucilaginibacter limnophilus]|uniref:Lipoprotein n=1 Tax=Mucilaginibacter limnophilus TaxID=1932778 RepID=A0A3S2V8N4_9SPHI|nr:hypothetical protein [Mucilaginibacter limnophilus]RVU01319.1 hypothetical protein EOD41_04970 [Mucilaginibacter limnophilus]
MHRLSYIYFIASLLIIACGEPAAKPPVISKPLNAYNIKTDIRFGRTFYSIYLNNTGYGYVVKGQGSPYTELFLRIDTAEMSKAFKIDSLYAVFQGLQALKRKPQLQTANTTDSAHVEIYYDGRKIYDDYTMSVKFWIVFRPMLTDLPEGFNPFIEGAFDN